jgi:hypothetical protein
VTENARLGALVFADGLASRCADALGDAMVSLILHGSLTLDDFAPHRSDIDLLMVVENPLSDKQLAVVRDAVDQARRDAPARVDLRAVIRAAAASPTWPTPLEAGFVLRPGTELETETRVVDEPDLLVELSVARTHGWSIVGRPPDSVIGPVPGEWLVALGDRQLADWESLTDDASHAELMVLTACRVWRFATDGLHSSKTAAGRWALAREPSLSAVDEALRQRTVDPAAVIGEEGIGHLLALIRQELRNHHPAPLSSG